MIKIYDITPASKPRMTQRDRWSKRPPVLKYYAFKDEVRHNNIHVPESGSHIIFHMPMPASWSKKKKSEMLGKPHQQRPDKDNLEKALLDAIFDEDCRVWDSRVTKIWSDTGRVEVRTQE